MTSRSFTIAMASLLALTAGCGPRAANLAGKVTFQGKPVVTGTVTVMAADGSIHQIGIKTDGTYTLDRVPVGPATVSVTSPDPAPSARAKALGDSDGRPKPGPPAVPPGAWFPLPAKYADPATSGLTLQVGSGSADLVLQ